jgi:hypothetical protein
MRATRLPLRSRLLRNDFVVPRQPNLRREPRDRGRRVPPHGGEIRAHGARPRGIHHWVELRLRRWGLGGDFDYRRLLATWKRVPSLLVDSHGAGCGRIELDGPPFAQRGFTVGGWMDYGPLFCVLPWRSSGAGQLEYSCRREMLQSSRASRGDHGIVFLDTGGLDLTGAVGRDHKPLRPTLGFGLSTSGETCGSTSRRIAGTRFRHRGQRRHAAPVSGPRAPALPALRVPSDCDA